MLAHLLSINDELEIFHSVRPSDQLRDDSNRCDKKLISPKDFSFYPFKIAAEIPNSCMNEGLSFSKTRFRLSLKSIDEDQKRPLFINEMSGHAILLIPEIINGIGEALAKCQCSLNGVYVKSKDNIIVVEFQDKNNRDIFEFIGNQLIFFAAINSLFFVRGLQLVRKSIEQIESYESSGLVQYINTILNAL